MKTKQRILQEIENYKEIINGDSLSYFGTETAKDRIKTLEWVLE